MQLSADFNKGTLFWKLAARKQQITSIKKPKTWSLALATNSISFCRGKELWEMSMTQKLFLYHPLPICAWWISSPCPYFVCLSIVGWKLLGLDLHEKCNHWIKYENENITGWFATGKSNKLCILIWLWVKSSCLACLQIMLLVYYFFIFYSFSIQSFLDNGECFGFTIWMGWMHCFLCLSDTSSNIQCFQPITASLSTWVRVSFKSCHLVFFF